MSPKCKFNIIRPNDSSYNKCRKNYNLAIDNYPSGIALCCNEYDIIKSLKFAKDHNLDFRIRSHRHDFEANSNLNCGLIIDLSKINYVNVDETEEIATVGGGATLGDIYDNLIIKGFTTPGGTCSDIGATSLATSAGIGYATRYLGLTLDNIVEITLIDSNLEKIIINSNTNWDLFWAIKGAQPSSFGVVSEIKFKIHKVSNVSYFKSTWYLDNAIELIDTFQNFAFMIDERLTMSLTLSKECNESIELSINGQFFGSKTELEALILPLFNIARPKSLIIDTVPYANILEIWNKECIPSNRFKNSGSFLYENLSRVAIDNILSFIKKSPKGYLHSIEMRSLGGKVLSFPNNTAVFPHREAHYLLQIKCIWEPPHNATLNQHWTNTFKHYLDTVGVGTYRGFTDFNICNWQFQYFGYNYNILREIKSKYDPKNFFKFYQSIQPLKYDFSKLTGYIITPDSTNYDEVRTLYKLHFYEYYPIVIVYASNFDDVKNAVLFAKNNYVSIRIKDEVYQYEGFSNENYSLLLDMSNLNSFKLNLYYNTITIGPGITYNEICEKLYINGYQFIERNSTMPKINIQLSEYNSESHYPIYGLPYDNLTSIKLIDNTGTLIMANTNYNSDIFFAIKEGREVLGIIVELTFKIIPIKKATPY